MEQAAERPEGDQELGLETAQCDEQQPASNPKEKNWGSCPVCEESARVAAPGGKTEKYVSH